MILTPEQEQQVQRILDIAERAATEWLAAGIEAHRRNAPAMDSNWLSFLNPQTATSDPKP